MTTLSPAAARRVYDRIGRLQDLQAFYEDKVTNEVIAHSKLECARSVFEFGCGTGRFAERLLACYLPADAIYCAVDVSPVMVGIARKRLARFGDRARVRLTGGEPPTDEESGSYDRFFSNFVLDLLSEEKISRVIEEAHRLLRPGGMLGLCSLTEGFTVMSRAFVSVWSQVYSFRPALTGGCRPVELLKFLPTTEWLLRHRVRVARCGVPLEAVVAERV